MNGDIKNNLKILKYPIIDQFENLTNDQIINYIEAHSNFIKKFKENENYYIGKNVIINTKKEVDTNNPDSRVSVPYARTMTSIVKGYMFRPNNILYFSNNELYLKKLKEIFKINNEPLKTSEMGEAQSKYGVGVELLYTDRNLKNEKETIPYFCSVNPAEVILFYSMNLYEKLIGAIRFYVVSEDEKKDEKKYKVEVYYRDKIVEYEMIEKSQQQKTIQIKKEYPNFFFDIPFVVYKNNTEYHADYEGVKTLMDSYDIMMSDSINEIQRFANAYLVLKNYIAFDNTDDNEGEGALEKLKTTRIFQFMGTDGGAEFLTKSIPSEFFNSVKDSLREDIQYHSHIPDFRSKNFESASGKALLYSLFDFENLCSDKQALFEVGLKKRIELINNFLKIKAIDSSEINIRFIRNLPLDVQDKVLQFVQLAGTDKLSDEDLLNILPRDILPNVEEALNRLKEKKEEESKKFDLDNFDFENEEQEKEEDKILKK